MSKLIANDYRTEDLTDVVAALKRLSTGNALAEDLRKIADAVQAGRDVVVVSAEDELTPTQAAKVLGMSRPHLYKLLDDGVLCAHSVGTHRRIRATDLEAFRVRREDGRRELAETFAHSDESRTAMTARLAGVDKDTASRLGF